MSLVLVWVLKVVVLSGEFEILMGVGFGVVLLIVVNIFFSLVPPKSLTRER